MILYHKIPTWYQIFAHPPCHTSQYLIDAGRGRWSESQTRWETGEGRVLHAIYIYFDFFTWNLTIPQNRTAIHFIKIPRDICSVYIPSLCHFIAIAGWQQPISWRRRRRWWCLWWWRRGGGRRGGTRCCCGPFNPSSWNYWWDKTQYSKGGSIGNCCWRDSSPSFAQWQSSFGTGWTTIERCQPSWCSFRSCFRCRA